MSDFDYDAGNEHYDADHHDAGLYDHHDAPETHEYQGATDLIGQPIGHLELHEDQYLGHDLTHGGEHADEAGHEHENEHEHAYQPDHDHEQQPHQNPYAAEEYAGFGEKAER